MTESVRPLRVNPDLLPAAREAVWPVRIHRLAFATAATCVLAQLLSRYTQGQNGTAAGAPGNVVVGQLFWNAAQVGLLIILICRVWVKRDWLTCLLLSATIILLPFAVYAISPGAAAETVLLLATCGLALVNNSKDIAFSLADVPAWSTPIYFKFEFLALICTILCSMYNFAANNALWPHWANIFYAVGSLFNFQTGQLALVKHLFALTSDETGLPSFILIGKPASSFGALVFTLIWTVLPALYVIYFSILARLAKDSPGVYFQQALCVVCIVHFLFFTDLVDYRFGRGVENQYATLAHWLEVFAWRIAVLLPIYQKITSGAWTSAGFAGKIFATLISVWALFFLVHEVLLVDVWRFIGFAFGVERLPLRPFGFRPEALAYHGALVLMTFVYGISIFSFPGKRISLKPMNRLPVPAIAA